MPNVLNFLINFQTNAEKITASFDKINKATLNITSATIKVNNAFSNMVNSINTKMESIRVVSIIQQINFLADGFSNLTTQGLRFNQSMAELSAITGATGNKLVEISNYARQNAKTFGIDAAQSVDSFKILLSKLGPEIAKQPEALKAMGASVAMLSKTMGGDTVAASEVLSTAMNQFGISLEDPMEAANSMNRMMNIMGAAAKEGSAELPQIKLALEQVGMAAKTAGLTFEETNAAIQVLDKAGKQGAEGGVALRNILTILSQGRFLPKETQDALKYAGIEINILSNNSLSLAARLEPLKKIINDNALVTQLFGRENANAAIAIINNTDEINRLTDAITNTNAVYQQAATIMETPAEKNARLAAKIEDFKISLFNASGGIIGYTEILGNLARDTASLFPIFNILGKGLILITDRQKLHTLWINITTAATKTWSMVQRGFNFIMSSNPIIRVITLIIGLVSVIMLAYQKIGWFRGIIKATWEVIKGFGQMLYTLIIDRIVSLVKGIGKLGEALYKVFKGDFKGAWMAAKDAAMDITGVNTVKKVVGQAKQMGHNAALAYHKGVEEIEKKKQAAGIKNNELIGEKMGINTSLTDAVNAGKPTIAQNPETTKTAETIQSGGARNITINLRNLIENVIYNGTMQDNKADLQRQMEESFIRLLQAAYSAG